MQVRALVDPRGVWPEQPVLSASLSTGSLVGDHVDEMRRTNDDVPDATTGERTLHRDGRERELAQFLLGNGRRHIDAVPELAGDLDRGGDGVYTQ